MSGQVVLSVDRLVSLAEEADQSEIVVAKDVVGPLCSRGNEEGRHGVVSIDEDEDEEEALIQEAECRICQEEGPISTFESPCACSGSLKYAHRKCVQLWCNEKGDITCEICHQTYQPGYTAPPRPPCSGETAIDIGGGWTISGAHLDLSDPRILAIADAERHFLETEYDEYATSNASAAFCRSVAFVLMVLLLLRHVLAITDADGDDDDDDDLSAFFSLFLLRSAAFLLPCYILAWAISILQRRRQRQEAAALAATQVALVLQHEQHRELLSQSEQQLPLSNTSNPFS